MFDHSSIYPLKNNMDQKSHSDQDSDSKDPFHDESSYDPWTQDHLDYLDHPIEIIDHPDGGLPTDAVLLPTDGRLSQSHPQSLLWDEMVAREIQQEWSRDSTIKIVESTEDPPFDFVDPVVPVHECGFEYGPSNGLDEKADAAAISSSVPEISPEDMIAINETIAKDLQQLETPQEHLHQEIPKHLHLHDNKQDLAEIKHDTCFWNPSAYDATLDSIDAMLIGQNPSQKSKPPKSNHQLKRKSRPSENSSKPTHHAMVAPYLKSSTRISRYSCKKLLGQWYTIFDDLTPVLDGTQHVPESLPNTFFWDIIRYVEVPDPNEHHRSNEYHRSNHRSNEHHRSNEYEYEHKYPELRQLYDILTFMLHWTELVLLMPCTQSTWTKRFKWTVCAVRLLIHQLRHHVVTDLDLWKTWYQDTIHNTTHEAAMIDYFDDDDMPDLVDPSVDLLEPSMDPSDIIHSFGG